MKNRTAWFIFLALFVTACNNDKKAEKTAGNTTDEHAGHQMPASGNTYADSVNTGLVKEDTLKGSPHRTAMATINGTDVQIEYGSPGVKGRIVWGGLVAYDKVWVTGAHKATSVQFNKEVTIEGKKIPAGQYAFFTIPGKDKWIVILNSRSDQHLADDYNEKEDIVRVEVKPEEHALTQRLTYAIEKINEKSGEIRVEWEKVMIKLAFTAN